jgi:predicted RNase H-like HicB family nuclease
MSDSSTLTTQPEIPAAGHDVPISIAVNLPGRIHRDPDGAIWADVPALPGCVAGGEDLDEVLANLKEAAEGWLLAKGDIETKGWPGNAGGTADGAKAAPA